MRKSDSTNDNVRHFRTSDRIMRINGQWWFAAREGDMGPYASREEALKQMETFIASQQFIEETDTESKPAPKKKSTFQGDTTIWDRQIDST